MTWTVQYDCNELPEAATPAWTKGDGGVGATIEISPAGFLHIVTSNSGFTYRIAANLSTSTLETRFKVISGQEDDYDTNFTNASAALAISIAGYSQPYAIIYTNSIRFDPSGNQYLLDTTDGYHKLRMCTENNEVKVYIDDTYVGTEPLTENQGVEENVVIFVPDFSGIPNMEMSWDYIYYDTSGAYAPGEGESPTQIAIGNKKFNHLKLDVVS